MTKQWECKFIGCNEVATKCDYMFMEGYLSDHSDPYCDYLFCEMHYPIILEDVRKNQKNKEKIK